jgi:predicted RNA methylase
MDADQLTPELENGAPSAFHPGSCSVSAQGTLDIDELDAAFDDLERTVAALVKSMDRLGEILGVEPEQESVTQTNNPKDMSGNKISPEVADVLRRSTITENLLVLPPGDLPFYAKVKKVLETAGGKWKTNKQGFVFDSDPREKLGLALETGVVIDEKKVRQAFYTPQSVAEEVALLAEVGGYLVLEPSAGDGALAKACLKAGAGGVHCIEMEETCLPVLRAIDRVSVEIGDFLKMVSPQVKRIVMNPPFTKGQDLKHVTHAKKWLAPGGKLFAIVPDKECPKFAAIGAVTVKRFPVGAFKESGTNVATRLIRIEQPADAA